MFISADVIERLYNYQRRELAAELNAFLNAEIDAHQLIQIYLQLRYQKLLVEHDSPMRAFAELYRELQLKHDACNCFTLICHDAADYNATMQILEAFTELDKLEPLTGQSEAQLFTQYGPTSLLVYKISSP